VTWRGELCSTRIFRDVIYGQQRSEELQPLHWAIGEEEGARAAGAVSPQRNAADRSAMLQPGAQCCRPQRNAAARSAMLQPGAQSRAVALAASAPEEEQVQAGYRGYI
jgi:hypothetical protein